MMKIARAVEQERRCQIRLVLTIKLFDQLWRRGESQLRPPNARVDYDEAGRFVRPRVIEIEMKNAVGQRLAVRGWKKFGIGSLGNPQVFLGFLVVRIAPQRFIELDNGLGDLTLGQVHSAEIVVGNRQLPV